GPRAAPPRPPRSGAPGTTRRTSTRGARPRWRPWWTTMTATSCSGSTRGRRPTSSSTSSPCEAGMISIVHSDRGPEARLHQADPPPPPIPADGAAEPVAAAVRGLMDALALDRGDPHLAGTDRRVARAWRELLSGRFAGPAPALRTFPNEAGYRDALTVLDI